MCLSLGTLKSAAEDQQKQKLLLHRRIVNRQIVEEI